MTFGVKMRLNLNKKKSKKISKKKIHKRKRRKKARRNLKRKINKNPNKERILRQRTTRMSQQLSCLLQRRNRNKRRLKKFLQTFKQLLPPKTFRCSLKRNIRITRSIIRSTSDIIIIEKNDEPYLRIPLKIIYPTFIIIIQKTW